MIRKLFSGNRNFVPTGLLIVILFLSSCKKETDDVPTPVSALMAFNLAPDLEGVHISLNGNLVPGSPLSYSSFTGQYFNVFPGTRFIETTNPANLEILDSLSYNFEPGKFYSLFIVGVNNGYSNIVTVDNYDSLTSSSGKSYVRYVNALSNAPASDVALSSEGSLVINDNIAFGGVSEFIAVEPGNLTVAVTNEGPVHVNRTLSLEQHKAYTILLMGLPNQSDTTRSVQIRYIENGTVTN